MNNSKNFGAVQNAVVTVLVDNRADLIVKSTDTVKYFTDKPLLAEHGFAALIDLKESQLRILWDAGITRIALLENMKRMEIDPASVDKIVLSHGHGDHTAGVSDILRAIDPGPKAKEWEAGASLEEMRRWAEGSRVPVIAHPAAFRERWGTRKDGTKFGPNLPPPQAEWEAIGAEIFLSEGPHQLGPGCWATGFVPRLSFEESGRRPDRVAYREGEKLIPDEIDEDQAIVINVEGKGLVVVAGCAHSGIVNTVNYARHISGIDRVWALLGGFHLARANDQEMERTIAAVKEYRPKLVAPSHCTGFKAMCQFATHMPEEFVSGVVGTKYLF
jgi:7,8-dihydropterin-6-yl-methyl-4-(beta-D-ribofuranosyl)aminobenzene 5'-phosphate synthase